MSKKKELAPASEELERIDQQDENLDAEDIDMAEKEDAAEKEDMAEKEDAAEKDDTAENPEQVNAEEAISTNEEPEEVTEEAVREKASGDENTEEKASKLPSKEASEEEETEKELTEDQIQSVFESILFTMGESVEIKKLAEVVGVDLRITKRLLQKMAREYEAENRGIMLTQFDNAVQLCTKPETYEYLIKIAKTPKRLTLTDTVIETLSIIAYKQPVTRLDVENIRGVNCDHAINKLLEYDLITELGRLDAPGRPILFGTTEQFLRCFGVKSLEELPELSTLQIEEFKAQAEEEIKEKLE